MAELQEFEKEFNQVASVDGWTQLMIFSILDLEGRPEQGGKRKLECLGATRATIARTYGESLRSEVSLEWSRHEVSRTERVLQGER